MKAYQKLPNRTRRLTLPANSRVAIVATWDDVKALDTVAATLQPGELFDRCQSLSNRLTYSLDLLGAGKTLPPPPDPVLSGKAMQAWTYWRDSLFPKRKTPTRAVLFYLSNRIKEGLDLGDWMQIVDWVRVDEWMSGKVSGKSYQEIWTLASSRDRIERYLDRSEKHFMALARDGVEVYPYEAIAFNEPAGVPGASTL